MACRREVHGKINIAIWSLVQHSLYKAVHKSVGVSCLNSLSDSVAWNVASMVARYYIEDMQLHIFQPSVVVIVD